MNNPVSEELVEATARAIHEFDRDSIRRFGKRAPPHWDNQIPEFHEYCRERAHAVLTSPAYQAELAAAERRGMERAAGIANEYAHVNSRRAVAAEAIAQAIRAAMEKVK